MAEQEEYLISWIAIRMVRADTVQVEQAVEIAVAVVAVADTAVVTQAEIQFFVRGIIVLEELHIIPEHHKQILPEFVQATVRLSLLILHQVHFHQEPGRSQDLLQFVQEQLLPILFLR